MAVTIDGTTGVTIPTGVFGDASGNVGIGTSSPGNKLVTASNAANSKIEIQNTSTAASTSKTSALQFTGTDTSGTLKDSGDIFVTPADNNYVGSNMLFYTRGSDTTAERMRIDSSGNLLIGYTSSNGSYKLQVNSQIFATSSTIATSDARYKENVEELSGALDIVKSLRPVSFDWKVHPIHNFDTKTKTVGFLAQDVQQTLAGKPYLNSIIKTNECVIEPEVKDENGNVTKEAVTEEFLGIAEGNMISILTAAIKELKAEFDAYVIAHP